MFEAIQYVGTPIALVAFIVAVVAYAYRARLDSRRKLIETAPESERGRVLEAALRDFTTVPTDTLTREQRYNLAVQLIEERRAKFRSLTLVSVIVAALLASVVIVFTLFPTESDAGPLTVRVIGPSASAASIANGVVTIDAGESNESASLDAQGLARFENIPNGAFDGGVRVSVRVPGLASSSDTTLVAVPRGRVVELQLEASPTRLYGTVIDEQHQPLAGIVLNFESGVAIDTTDAHGNFSVSVPHPPGTQIPVRATQGGITGLHEQITIPDGSAITLLFATRT